MYRKASLTRFLWQAVTMSKEIARRARPKWLSVDTFLFDHYWYHVHSLHCPIIVVHILFVLFDPIVTRTCYVSYQVWLFFSFHYNNVRLSMIDLMVMPCHRIPCDRTFFAPSILFLFRFFNVSFLIQLSILTMPVFFTCICNSTAIFFYKQC